MRQLTGDVCRIITASQELKVAQLPQDVPKDLAGTVYDVVADGLGEVGHLIARYHHIWAGSRNRWRGR